MAKEQKKNAQSKLKRIAESDEGEAGQQGKEADCIATKEEESAASMLEFLEKARSGEMIPPEVIVRFSHHFRDDLTLDNMPRMQLINMCKYMNIPPYGADSFLRFSLRHHIRTLIEDDQRILWEGIDSLNTMELREACRERGMRSTGLNTNDYKRSLQQWLDLSVNKHIPISLLVMSRTFFLNEATAGAGAPSVSAEDQSVAGLADAISGMDQDIVNEVVLEIATSEEKKKDPNVTKIKLEVLEAQNERILEEQIEREAAKKKEEEKGKEKAEEKAEKEKAEQEKRKLEKGLEAGLSSAPELPEEGSVVNSAVEKVVAEKTISDDDDAVVEEEDDPDLTSEEMEALAELVNPDPVNREKETLQKIKEAMKEEEPEIDVVESTPELMHPADDEPVTAKKAEKKAMETAEPTNQAPVVVEEPLTAEVIDEHAKQVIEKADEMVAVEAAEMTKMDGGAEIVEVEDVPDTFDTTLDRSIARLKSKVKKMVDNIETQITKVEGKIGDKLHFLDKDMDGILTLEEMAVALQQVLKRDISLEEAMEIAKDMDENEDGVFTVVELINWIETHKMEQLIKEGRTGEIEENIDYMKTEKPEKVTEESAAKKSGGEA